MLDLRRDPELTRSEIIEAECRRLMANLTQSRGFDSGRTRAIELEMLDDKLDEWNAITCRP